MYKLLFAAVIVIFLSFALAGVEEPEPVFAFFARGVPTFGLGPGRLLPAAGGGTDMES